MLHALIHSVDNSEHPILVSRGRSGDVLAPVYLFSGNMPRVGRTLGVELAAQQHIITLDPCFVDQMSTPNLKSAHDVLEKCMHMEIQQCACRASTESRMGQPSKFRSATDAEATS